MTSAFGRQQSPMMTSADNVGEGWHQIIRDLEAGLNEIDPEFHLIQVKEKFGALRYYAEPHHEMDRDIENKFQTRINTAEGRSQVTCEFCGQPGETHSIGGWLKTLCDEHHAERLDRYEATS